MPHRPTCRCRCFSWSSLLINSSVLRYSCSAWYSACWAHKRVRVGVVGTQGRSARHSVAQTLSAPFAQPFSSLPHSAAARPPTRALGSESSSGAMASGLESCGECAGERLSAAGWYALLKTTAIRQRTPSFLPSALVCPCTAYAVGIGQVPSLCRLSRRLEVFFYACKGPGWGCQARHCADTWAFPSRTLARLVPSVSHHLVLQVPVPVVWAGEEPRPP